MTAEAILAYELKAAVLIAAFYMFYRLLLSRETLHRMNRIVLLVTAALSFILPLCVITVTRTMERPGTADAEVPAIQEAADTVANADAAHIMSTDLCTILLMVLIAGVALVLCRTLASALRLRRIIRNGRKETLPDGTAIVVSPETESEFSWFGTIVIPEDGRENLSEEIILHEKAHMTLGHSYDILFTDMLTAFQWFNPAIWMLRGDLRAIHEFQADDAVLRSGANARQYQFLLINKAIGMSGYSVANGFNHSSLKKRITMMLSKKSSWRAALKALYVIPIIGISLAASGRTVVEYTDTGKDTQISQQDQWNFPEQHDPDLVWYLDGEKMTTKGVLHNIKPENFCSISAKTTRKGIKKVYIKTTAKYPKMKPVVDTTGAGRRYYINNSEVSAKEYSDAWKQNKDDVVYCQMKKRILLAIDPNVL